VDTIAPDQIGEIPVPRLEPAREQLIHKLIELAATLRARATAKVRMARQEVLRIHGLEFQLIDERTRNPDGSIAKVVAFGVTQLSSNSLNAINYSPARTNMLKSVLSLQHLALGELVEPNGIFEMAMFKRVPAAPAHGVELIGQREMFLARPSGRFISKHSVARYEEFYLQDGGIAIAARGTLGEGEVFCRCAFSHKNFEGKMLSDNIMRVLPKPDRIDPGYLFAFLSSEFGFRLIRTTIRGTKLALIVPSEIAALPVPLVNRSQQVRVGALIRDAYEERAEANQIEDEVQALLIDALGYGDDGFSWVF
jgi:type I restriction enzyme S subunit